VLTPIGQDVASRIARDVTERVAPGAETPSLVALIRALGTFAHDLRAEVSAVRIEAVSPVGGLWRCLDASVTVSRAVDAMSDRI
jgi:hypothetical protein